MSAEASAKVVKACYEYLVNILLASGTTVDRLSNFRVEELSNDPTTKNYKITLSYDVSGDFAFDKKREYKDFETLEDGTVLSMRIRNIK